MQPQGKRIRGDAIEQLGCGDALQVIAVDGEALDHGVAEIWRSITQHAAQTLRVAGFSVLAVEVVPDNAEQAGTHQDAAELTERPERQPIP